LGSGAIRVVDSVNAANFEIVKLGDVGG
jgi:hypothetical protein